MDLAAQQHIVKSAWWDFSLNGPMTAEYFLCDEDGGDSIGIFHATCDESKMLDKIAAKTVHFFGKYLSGNDGKIVNFDNDVFYVPPSLHADFIGHMDANGFEEPIADIYVLDCISSMQELITGERSEMIVDKPDEPSEMIVDKPDEPSEQIFDKAQEPITAWQLSQTMGWPYSPDLDLAIQTGEVRATMGVFLVLPADYVCPPTPPWRNELHDEVSAGILALRNLKPLQPELRRQDSCYPPYKRYLFFDCFFDFLTFLIFSTLTF